MLKRWDKFTLFLRQAGAPLDNNLCERALKKVILHRNYVKFRIMLSSHPAAACFRGTSGIGSSHNHRPSRNCISGFAAARRDRATEGDLRDANAFFFDSRSACKY